MKRLFINLLIIVVLLCVNIRSSLASERLLLGIVGRSISNWPVYVMFDKGLLKGIKPSPRLINFRDENRAVSSLISGSVNSLGVISTEKILLYQMEGAPIEIVGGLVKKVPLCLVMNRKLKSIRDLQGKLIGVPSYEGYSTNLVESIMMGYDLYYPFDFKMVPLGGEDAGYTAVKYGKLPAAIVSVPAAIKGENEGIFQLEKRRRSFPEYPFKVLAMNRYWSRDYEREAVSVLSGIIEAIDWLYNPENKNEAIKILMKHIKIEPDIAGITYEIFFTEDRIFSVDAHISHVALMQVFKSLSGKESVKKKYDISKFYNDRYRIEALKMGK